MIEEPIWILCNPRTGSSILCENLNNTHMFKPYNHPLLSKYGESRVTESGRAFCEWMRLFNNKHDFERNPPSFLKNIHHQHIEALRSVDISYIESIIPNIKFILLKRLNISMHVASLYIAKKTDKWHLWGNSGTKEYSGINIDIDYDMIDACFEDVIKYQTNWDMFLKGHACHVVFYEDICKDPISVIRNISGYFNLNISDNIIIESCLKNRLLLMRDHQQSIYKHVVEYINGKNSKLII